MLEAVFCCAGGGSIICAVGHYICDKGGSGVLGYRLAYNAWAATSDGWWRHFRGAGGRGGTAAFGYVPVGWGELLVAGEPLRAFRVIFIRATWTAVAASPLPSYIALTEARGRCA